ncbi:MAG: anti-virulence regulator CigR family protein [Porticoccaceae bacterium]
MNPQPLLIALLAAALLVATPLVADSPGKGRDKASGEHHPGAHRGGDGADAVETLITAGITLALARELAQSHQYTGYKPLPPGIRKNLARGKPLPPGIAKRGLPGPLLAELPHYDGYEWRRAGTDLVLVAVASALIADVLVDVFR